jgi:hypothetical protein
MYTQEDKDNFFNAIKSLKKYRRADLLDDKVKNLLERYILTYYLIITFSKKAL